MTDPNVPNPSGETPDTPETPAVPAAPAAPEAAPVPPVAPPAPPAYGAPAAPAAPAYGAGTYDATAPAYGAPAPAKTNVLAIVSLVSSIIGFFTGIGFLVGIVCGHISLSQIKKTAEQGRGMAIAGLVIGYIGIVISIIVTIVFFVFLATLSASYNYNY
ncbi:DUF4190 domain-containing protein [Agromyces sp. PvR057]|uniref:DUF4190 domain-containing protein n=1 Tax=Agromyces sp. PvR057 TaxID=3156403 RepID=UPI0033975855